MGDTPTTQVLKAMFLDGLARLLDSDGFTLKKRDQRFERRFGETIQIIHLSFVEDRNRSGVSAIVNLSVRHGEVENIVNYTGLSALKHAATVGAQLGRILGKGQLRWTATNESDVEQCATEIYTLIVEHGLNYLERYSSLENVRVSFESRDPRDWQQLAGGRALRLPVILALLGRKSDAEKEFVRQYHTLRSAKDPLSTEFVTFARNASERLELAFDEDEYKS